MRIRKTNKDQRIKVAVLDYYNQKGSVEMERIILHIAGRKKLNLTEQEVSDIWAIRENMKDTDYMAGLIGTTIPGFR